MTTSTFSLSVKVESVAPFFFFFFNSLLPFGAGHPLGFSLAP